MIIDTHILDSIGYKSNNIYENTYENTLYTLHSVKKTISIAFNAKSKYIYNNNKNNYLVLIKAQVKLPLMAYLMSKLLVKVKIFQSYQQTLDLNFFQLLCQNLYSKQK